MLSLSQTAADMIRSWLLLHIGSRVSIAMIADFLGKLLRLPLPFFDSRTAGDIMQRIGDHRRVKILPDVVVARHRFFAPHVGRLRVRARRSTAGKFSRSS